MKKRVGRLALFFCFKSMFTWLGKVYFQKNIFWFQGYFVSSIGLDEEKIKHYVEYQGRLDLGQLRLELEGKGT